MLHLGAKGLYIILCAYQIDQSKSSIIVSVEKQSERALSLSYLTQSLIVVSHAHKIKALGSRMGIIHHVADGDQHLSMCLHKPLAKKLGLGVVGRESTVPKKIH